MREKLQAWVAQVRKTFNSFFENLSTKGWWVTLNEWLENTYKHPLGKSIVGIGLLIADARVWQSLWNTFFRLKECKYRNIHTIDKLVALGLYGILITAVANTKRQKEQNQEYLKDTYEKCLFLYSALNVASGALNLLSMVQGRTQSISSTNVSNIKVRISR